ncbi:MAG: DUF1330 domain-containing protein, partial [Pseudomonas sp.]|uniref:DUF1330 domain-containing protein n=1 Tax=Pseudomonas sp. TaxID=306 RepID=UPI0033164233
MKAYWIAHVDVTDPEQYQQYTQRAPAAFKAYGGSFLRILCLGGPFSAFAYAVISFFQAVGESKKS